jgi:hypothetical protein
MILDVVFLAFMVRSAPAVDAQQSAGQAAEPRPLLDIVQTIGCLTETSKDTWMLTSAAEPAVSKLSSTSSVELKEADAKPLGNMTFRLLGVSLLKPAAHKDHKIWVKGVLIKDAADPRINVTSLHMVNAICK